MEEYIVRIKNDPNFFQRSALRIFIGMFHFFFFSFLFVLKYHSVKFPLHLAQSRTQMLNYQTIDPQQQFGNAIS